MTGSPKMEMLTRLLERMPGVAFCSRMDPATGKSQWVHIDAKKAAEFYDVDEAAMLADPFVTLDPIHPEDRAHLNGVIAQRAQEGGSMASVVRYRRRNGEIRWMETHANIEREPDGTVLWYGQTLDVTERKQLEQSLVTSEATKSELIERLRHAVDELSNPIMEVWEGTLVMPIIGIVDSRRTTDMVQRLLQEVTRMQASFVIIDLTGVDVVDTMTADHLMRLMRKVEVVGARCVLTGIRPAVAETLVDLGVDFSRLSTLRNLKHGLREALRLARREREELRTEDLDDELGEEPAQKKSR